MAGIKISALPAIVAPALTDIFATVQAGTTYKVTGTQMVSLFSSNIAVNSVTNAMLAQMGAYTIKGNDTNATADVADIAAGQFPATHTNDNAAAGNQGEYISSTVLVGAAVPVTSGVNADVTSISLTAGDWDVNGVVVINPGVGTTSSQYQSWINTVSANQPTPPNEGGFGGSGAALPAGGGAFVPCGPMRMSLASTTTVYLSAVVTFAVSTMSVFGFIGARRAR